MRVLACIDPESLAALRRQARRLVWMERGEDAEVLVHGSPEPDLVDRMPSLRAIVVPWAGVPSSTLGLVRDRSHLSLHNLHHNAEATAEQALALLFAVARQVVPRDQGMRRGAWVGRFGPGEDATLLWGKTALVLGGGAIGSHLAKVCRAMGMKVVVVRRRPGPGAFGVEELDKLLPRSQVLLISAPLTHETHGLIDARRLALLPAGALLVNIGRGPIVEEAALYDALATGRLGGAGLDVWWHYPSHADEVCHPSAFPIHELPNVVMSPHRGGATDDSERLRMAALARLLKALASGDDSTNRVDVRLGY